MWQIEELFKEFHRNPELSNEETETTERIRRLLGELQVEVLDTPLKTGLIARIPGKAGGLRVGLRADIDALPIQEETGLPYASCRDGVMHACGHDIHICTALETARRLVQNQEAPSGDVYLIFQPAEETAFGARQVMETGILDRLDCIISLHDNPELEVGTFGIRQGSITSSVDIIELKLHGVGAHGAKPEEGRDVIVAASALILNLQTVISRNVRPTSAAVLSVTHVEAGSTYNILPDEAFLEGTIRTADNRTRGLIRERICEIVRANDALYGVHTEIIWEEGPPATDNDAELTRLAQETVTALGYKAVTPELSMVGEDFAFYQERKKGFMIWVGAGKGAALHSPRFRADPRAITIAAEFFEQYIRRLQQ